MHRPPTHLLLTLLHQPLTLLPQTQQHLLLTHLLPTRQPLTLLLQTLPLRSSRPAWAKARAALTC
ncbi:MAG: hypothetical protein ACO1QR_02455 [Chthoniobacteraceae bacterium]